MDKNIDCTLLSDKTQWESSLGTQNIHITAEIIKKRTKQELLTQLSVCQSINHKYIKCIFVFYNILP